MRSNSACSVVSSATSDTSASEKVTEPPPSRASAPMAALTASGQRGLGTPRPRVQSALPTSPASAAAARIRARPSIVCAEQASNRPPVSSIRKRRVNGVITGRGADRSRTSVMPSGLARDSAVSSRRFSAPLSVIAVISTRFAETEIFERGSLASASSEKLSAWAQPPGTG